MKNDVLVEKAVESVARSLVIFVTGRDKHEVVNYTSELYSLVWDVACLQGKPLLDIRYSIHTVYTCCVRVLRFL